MVALAQELLRHREVGRAAWARAHERVVFFAEAAELGVIQPRLLNEFELPAQVRVEHDEEHAAIDVGGRVGAGGRQGRPVGAATSDEAVFARRLGRCGGVVAEAVARVAAAHVRAERAAQAAAVVGEREDVGVGEGGVIVVAERQRGAALPAAYHARSQELGGSGVGRAVGALGRPSQVRPEGDDVLGQLPEDQVGAVASEVAPAVGPGGQEVAAVFVGRDAGRERRRAVLVLVAEHELAGRDRLVARRRPQARAGEGGLRQAVTKAEVLASFRGEVAVFGVHEREPARFELVSVPRDELVERRAVAGEEHEQEVERLAPGGAELPMFGRGLVAIAERARPLFVRHALPKLARKRRRRRRGEAEPPQPRPAEGDVRRVRRRLRAAGVGHLGAHEAEPTAGPGRVDDAQEQVARAGQALVGVEQQGLQIVERKFRHGASFVSGGLARARGVRVRSTTRGGRAGRLPPNPRASGRCAAPRAATGSGRR